MPGTDGTDTVGDEVSPAQPVALVLSVPVAPACGHQPIAQPGCPEENQKESKGAEERGVMLGGPDEQIEVGDGKSPFPLVSPVPPGFRITNRTVLVGKDR